MLSNHGVRQLDGVLSPLDILAQTVDATGGDFDVLVDGGVGRGSDIVKAVALGARGFLLGRAPLYGLAANGAESVADVLTLLRSELEICMRLLGCTELAGLGRRHLVVERDVDGLGA